MQEAGVMCRILSVVALLAIGISTASAQTAVTNSLDPIIRPWQYGFGTGCNNYCHAVGPTISDDRVLINYVSCYFNSSPLHAPNFISAQLIGSTLNGSTPTIELIPHLLGNNDWKYQFSQSTNYVLQRGDQPAVNIETENSAGEVLQLLQCTLSGYSLPLSETRK